MSRYIDTHRYEEETVRRRLEVLQEPPAACCVPLAAPSLSQDEAEATARVFRALADPARVRIVNALATSGGPVCACDFQQPLGLSQPTVSHHLRTLLDAGLVEREQRGRWAYFSLNREAVETLAAIADLKEVTT
jgi:ArsR family transcriptional regulator, arsenate/arsenite/antimonite-responsive transcriptional repressor